MTLQDYFPLCSTFKLLDAAGRVCYAREIGADCAATVRRRPAPSRAPDRATLEHHVGAHAAGLRRASSGLVLQWRLERATAKRWGAAEAGAAPRAACPRHPRPRSNAAAS